MLRRRRAEKIVNRIGAEILNSDGMELEKHFLQHGNVSVYNHSYSVAVTCVIIAMYSPFKVNINSLVRGALLHDYFLYDWHIPDERHRLHGFSHAEVALKNAERDFKLGNIEKNMILSHMFPLNLILPKYIESLILCMADKVCAAGEILF